MWIARNTSNGWKRLSRDVRNKASYYTSKELVESENPHSSIIDGGMTLAIGNLVKIFSWYDNEWGYSNRLADFMKFMASKEV